jgi:hypothetical protein
MVPKRCRHHNIHQLSGFRTSCSNHHELESTSSVVLRVDASQNIRRLQSNVTPLFAKAISDTGDLGSSNLSVRIQIGKVPDDTSGPPRVLSVDSNGTPAAEPWDCLSAQQVWSYLDWDKRPLHNTDSHLRLFTLSDNNLVLSYTHTLEE